MPSARVSRANNITILYKIGNDAQAGAAISTSTDNPVLEGHCLARSWSRSVEIGTTDGGAFCDTEMKMVPTRVSGTVEMELIVPAASSTIFYGQEGRYCRVTTDIGYTTLSDVGVVTSTSISSDLDGIITESVTITLGISGVTAMSAIVP